MKERSSFNHLTILQSIQQRKGSKINQAIINKQQLHNRDSFHGIGVPSNIFTKRSEGIPVATSLY
jgi:hypothetical protein